MRLVIAAVLLAMAPGVFAARAPMPTTPPGVMLVEVVRELNLSQPDYLWTRLGGPAGETLFYSATECLGECAKEFPPLMAHAGAKAFGDWSLIKRDAGKQWAYQKHPLYRWVKETVAGEVANNVGLRETAEAKLAEGAKRPTDLMPPAGWQVARFTPWQAMSLPDGITADFIPAAQAAVLKDFKGFTLYAFDGDARKDGQACSDDGCQVKWLPAVAGGLASPIGDFSIVARKDGSRQWAYRKKPLYRYVGDQLPGDVLGAAVDGRWALAALTQSFRPAGVTVTNVEGYGNMWALNGMTLYGGHAFFKLWGGRNLRDGFRDSYARGKRLGTAACVSRDCRDQWIPFIAPADAVANGFWEVFTREDGTRQWAYKGFALYTKKTDAKPGDLTGQSLYDFAWVGGDEAQLERVTFLAQVGGDTRYGSAGIYWTVARP
jgi:predicted lipoprotein with Yx(FWY)xxD motif